MPIRLHADDPDLLRQAIGFTARETGFALRLVEKDYYCSVVLEYLAASGAGLTFKGGTCISKVHADLYRLSEDLDFSISTPLDSTRADRSRSADRLKGAVDSLPDTLPGFRILDPLRGANNSTQYNARVGYESLLDGHLEPVSIEVGVREPTMLDAYDGAAGTLVLDPLTGKALVETYRVACLSCEEAMAEKVRAALCRREVAIRDWFDVDHAVHAGILKPGKAEFVDLLRRKLAIPGTGAIDISADRMAQLRRQVDGQLRPVLRQREFARFDLDRAIATVRRVAEELARR